MYYGVYSRLVVANNKYQKLLLLFQRSTLVSLPLLSLSLLVRPTIHGTR